MQPNKNTSSSCSDLQATILRGGILSSLGQTSGHQQNYHQQFIQLHRTLVAPGEDGARPPPSNLYTPGLWHENTPMVQRPQSSPSGTTNRRLAGNLCLLRDGPVWWSLWIPGLFSTSTETSRPLQLLLKSVYKISFSGDCWCCTSTHCIRPDNRPRQASIRTVPEPQKGSKT